MMTIEEENRLLRDQNKELLMVLSAVKLLTTRINPVCAEKLEKLLTDCEGCKGE